MSATDQSSDRKAVIVRVTGYPFRSRVVSWANPASADTKARASCPAWADRWPLLAVSFMVAPWLDAPPDLLGRRSMDRPCDLDARSELDRGAEEPVTNLRENYAQRLLLISTGDDHGRPASNGLAAARIAIPSSRGVGPLGQDSTASSRSAPTVSPNPNAKSLMALLWIRAFISGRSESPRGRSTRSAYWVPSVMVIETSAGRPAG